ncbi:hypothetical protein [Nocardioides sp.]|uniref:hypothetical protein n=1 Tax=Nocardioides sp. TaxID=35761 RepID=UPI0039E6DBAD
MAIGDAVAEPPLSSRAVELLEHGDPVVLVHAPPGMVALAPPGLADTLGALTGGWPGLVQAAVRAAAGLEPEVQAEAASYAVRQRLRVELLPWLAPEWSELLHYLAVAGDVSAAEIESQPGAPKIAALLEELGIIARATFLGAPVLRPPPRPPGRRHGRSSAPSCTPSLPAYRGRDWRRWPPTSPSSSACSPGSTPPASDRSTPSGWCWSA